MNGDFFNYQNKPEYPVWHAWDRSIITFIIIDALGYKPNSNVCGFHVL